MHRKVKWWITFIVVVILVLIAAFAIVAKADNSWVLGGEIIKYEPACTAATAIQSNTGILSGILGNSTPGCPAIPCRCLRCGCVSAPCTPPPPKWSEILIRPIGRTMQYSCPPIGYKYSGFIRVPAPKRHILGYGLDAYAPFKTGLGR